MKVMSPASPVQGHRRAVEARAGVAPIGVLVRMCFAEMTLARNYSTGFARPRANQTRLTGTDGSAR